jgi:hypothetical protein
MHKLAIVAFTLMGIGMVLVAAIVADSAGATRADAEGYAQAITVNSSDTPASIVAQEHALFQR